MHIVVGLQLFTNEGLHSLEIFFIECLAHQVQNEHALLVADRAENESAHHVKHRLDDPLAQNVVENDLLADGSTASEAVNQDAELLHGADAKHASLGHDRVRLVAVRIVTTHVASAKEHQAIVGKVLEVCHDCVEGLFFALLEEADVFLLRELSQELTEEVEGVGLVLRVGVGAADDINDASDDIRLRQITNFTTLPIFKIGGTTIILF